MRGEYLSIDLETTGLEPSRDQIIEIGAVRVRDGMIVEEWTTLINPGRAIPAMITQLTGIRTEDVVGAPDIQSALPGLIAFAGDTPWVAHNIEFDASFLNRAGALKRNQRIDTYELAAILLPQAPRYNLNSLTQSFAIEIGEAHRALYDARATALLYLHLWNQTLALPYATLREIVETAPDLAWSARPVFEMALREREAQPYTAPTIFDLFPPRPLMEPSSASGEARTVGGVLASGGALETTFAAYEARAGQLEMAQAVKHALDNGEMWMIEAGTGIGKSLGYLVPAAVHALATGERVVISTNTLNLQDQLIQQEIPTLRAALDTPLEVAVMKGRANYLCPHRFSLVRQRQPTNVDELRMLAKLLVWLTKVDSGEKGDISLRGSDEHDTWQRLSAEDDGCTVERCEALMEGVCPFHRARKTAERAPLLIVNHALLVADATSTAQVLPDYHHLIIDEAHNLEEAVTSGSTRRLDEKTLRRRLGDLGTLRRGMLGTLLNRLRSSVSEKDLRRMEAGVRAITDAITAADANTVRVFATLRAFAHDVQPNRGEYSTFIRITDASRNRASFQPVQSSYAQLHDFLNALSGALRQLVGALERLRLFPALDRLDLSKSAESAARFLDETRAQLSGLVQAPDPNTVYWMMTGQEDDYLVLHTAPLHVGRLLENLVWSKKKSVILTSATLQTHGGFDYLRERLQLADAHTLEIPSPFNYQDAVLILTPNDMPDPGDRNRYQTALEKSLIEIGAALKGRMMVLFTSFSHLRQTVQAVAPRLALGGIQAFDQSDGTPRQVLLDGFRNADRGVLFGTRSFWEGVDIPGEALSALVIVKLPFSVPTDPVFSARGEAFTNAFDQYTLPDAVLRFRQGFGRLIRRHDDRGVVIILDGRVITKSYGTSFLEALPESKNQTAPLGQLPELALRWIQSRS